MGKKSLEDKANISLDELKKECNGHHVVHEEPADREELMTCYSCGLMFSAYMAREYDLEYKVDNN